MTIAIDVDNARLVYASAGSPYPQTPTIVLVHGFPLSRAMWQAQLEGLSPACHVVAPDLRGYGESSFGDWPAEGETPSLDRYADDL